MEFSVDGGISAAAGDVKPRRAMFSWRKRRGGNAQTGDRPAGEPREHAQRLSITSRVIVAGTLLGLGVLLVCSAVGYGLARQSDESQAMQRRAALRAGISEFRALFQDFNEVDPRLVRMLEQSSGLQGLKFETEPAPGAREAHPLLTSQGRIVGFFTWEPDWPMTLMVNRLLPVAAALALCLAGFAGLSLWQLRRARLELAASDSDARKAAQQDRLSGLPNRGGVLELLGVALDAREGERAVTFALLKLDGLNDINNQFGQQGGDDLIAKVAARLREALPPQAVCGRFGGDEFALILAADVDANDCLRAAIEAASQPLWMDTAVRIGARAGFAQAPRDGTSGEELARCADIALRSAKRQAPGSIVAFAPEIDAEFNDRQFIKRELTRALNAQMLELHYQPIVTANGARIVGVEALLRWNHPSRGNISPAIFIPIAEQMGLMDELGEFVLRRALVTAMRWPDLYIAVNLSPLQMRDRGIIDLVREVLAATKILPSRVMFEITEGVLIDNPDEMKRRIADLRALGVRIALDDFGSGYSSLSYLQQFPFDKLKIDRGFVAPLGRSANGGVIIQAIIALGRALGMNVLVEGVETEEQRVLLRLAGCDEMQGFLFARAMPAAAIDRLLAKPNAAAVADAKAVA